MIQEVGLEMTKKHTQKTQTKKTGLNDAYKTFEHNYFTKRKRIIILNECVIHYMS